MCGRSETSTRFTLSRFVQSFLSFSLSSANTSPLTLHSRLAPQLHSHLGIMSSPASIAQTSRLLILPAELRNEIYDLVLTTVKPVSCASHQIEDRIIHRFSAVADGTPTPIELNQLKLTCRQLYLETRRNTDPSSPHVPNPQRYH